MVEPAVKVVTLFVLVMLRLALQLRGVATVAVLLPVVDSPIAATVRPTVLVCGPGQAAEDTPTVAVMVTKLLLAAIG